MKYENKGIKGKVKKNCSVISFKLLVFIVLEEFCHLFHLRHNDGFADRIKRVKAESAF